jgi:hypothetical protein
MTFKRNIFIGLLLIAFNAAWGQTENASVIPDTAQKAANAPRIYPQGYVKHHGDTSAFVASITPMGLQIYSSLHLEGTINKNFSAGGSISQYFKEITGTKIELFGRYYIINPAPNGFYVQTRFGIGAFSHDFNPTYIGPAENPITDIKKFYGYFGGAGLGYQLVFGKNRNLVLDVNASYQLSTIKKSDFIHTYGIVKPLTFQEGVIDHQNYVDQYGPAGKILLEVSFGYVLVK